MRESTLRQKLQPCCACEETERQRKIEGAEKLVIGLTSEYRRGMRVRAIPARDHPIPHVTDGGIEHLGDEAAAPGRHRTATG
jgi:hypothetical protein